MPYPVASIPPKTLNQFCVVNGAFTEEEVDKIIDLEDLQKFQRGGVGSGAPGGGSINTKARDSEVMWIMHDQNSDWLFQKFSHLVSMVNHDHFMYEIEGFDNFQYTRYKKGEYYNWHIDSGNVYSKFERKISCSIILTDPSKYEAGELQCVVTGDIENPVTIKPNKGDAVFFASWMPHRVVPVTKGTRKSLVCWISGPRG